MAQATTLQPTGLPGKTRSFAAKAAATGVLTTLLNIISSATVEPNHIADLSSNLLMAGAIEVQGGAYFGGGSNHTDIDSTGVVTMAGAAKRILTVRPDFDYSSITAQGKPTRVTVGAHQGFSLPIYAPDEEIFMGLNVPGRWDGASDIVVDILVALSAAETANDDFNLQLSWENTRGGSGTGTSVVLDATPIDVEVETNIPDARKAQYNTFLVQFTIDYDADVTILSHDLLSMRIRRLAVAGTEIAGEIIVLDAHCHFAVNKMFKAPE